MSLNPGKFQLRLAQSRGALQRKLMPYFTMAENENPPFPQEFLIPQPIVEAWIRLSSSHILDQPIRKSDVDSLYFSLQRLIDSQRDFQASMIAYTNGQLPEANRLNDAARRGLIEASNHSKQFIAGIMAAHTVKSGSDGR